MSQQPRPSLDELLLVGQITSPFGVHGQLNLHAITNRPEHLRRVSTVFVGENLTPYKLKRAAPHKPTVLIVTLNGIDSREAAETLRGQEVYIRQADAMPLDEDEYYLHDLPGLRVETADGTAIGTVKEVLETGANEVLVVTRPEGGEALIPMIKDVVKRLDIAGGLIVVEPLPGMLDDK
ncbi:MAG TPA: ribosome maturation factor RimM [Herpetosiphonaceae bacterium]